MNYLCLLELWQYPNKWQEYSQKVDNAKTAYNLFKSLGFSFIA